MIWCKPDWGCPVADGMVDLESGSTPGAGIGFTITEAGPHEAEIVRLARLDPITYDQQREGAAKAIGIRVSTLDEAVQAQRPMPEAATGRGVSLPEAEPWPSAVGAAELLDALTAAVRRHVILRPAAAEVVALWIAHTWVAEKFQHTPRLGITSPAKRCGKSTLLDVLRATCRRPLKADNISASGVFRTVEALAPLTLLLDEADSFIADNDELRGVLNSGFERSGEVIRVVEKDGEHQPIRFRTFAPVALAGIGALPATLEDRAVPVVLQRKGAREATTKLRAPGARSALADLARKLARWAADRGPALTLNPDIPEAMGDREGDIAVPLLAVADDADLVWGKRARAALLDVLGKREADGGNIESGGLLLADLRDLYRERGATRLPSAAIVVALAGMEERPWPEWKGGKPITVTQLAKALAPFRVRPQNMRDGQGVVKGYTLESFHDAFARYLPTATPVLAESPPPEALQRYTVVKTCENSNASRYAPEECSGPECKTFEQKQVCSGVAGRNGGAGVGGTADERWSAEF